MFWNLWSQNRRNLELIGSQSEEPSGVPAANHRVLFKHFVQVEEILTHLIKGVMFQGPSNNINSPAPKNILWKTVNQIHPEGLCGIGFPVKVEGIPELKMFEDRCSSGQESPSFGGRRHLNDTQLPKSGANQISDQHCFYKLSVKTSAGDNSEQKCHKFPSPGDVWRPDASPPETSGCYSQCFGVMSPLCCVFIILAF